MKQIARPTKSEIDRLEELANQYFVGEHWAIEAKFWDDGDIHLEAFSTIGVGQDTGYPKSVAYHRQILRYERQSNLCEYENIVMQSNNHSRVLNEFWIDW